MAQSESTARVLVVGAGPTGLMMAAELARHGVQCRIAEMLAQPSDKSRALAIQSRTLEIFDNLGIADEIAQAGFQVRDVNFFSGSRRISHSSFEKLDTPYPYVLMLPQSETEAFLTRHLASFGIKPERGVELTGLTQDPDGVTASLLHAGGRTEQCRCDYLVGCDGAHSSVRHALDLAFDGAQYPEHFVLADVRVKWDVPEDQLNFYLTSASEGILAFFPFGNERYRVMADIPDGQAGDEPTLGEVQALVDRRGPAGTKLDDPRWLSHFTIHRRQVASYRVGRVFLAGDAAHIHSPAGGQGMNSGLQDAYNLGWKLGLAIAGAASPSLLDSYQAERHAVGQSVLKMSDTLTRLATLRHPVAQKVRDQIGAILSSLNVVSRKLAPQIAELDVNYRKSPIVGESAGRGVEAFLRFPMAQTVRNWLEFGGGPASGERAPHVEPVELPGGSPTSLARLTRSTGHTLLLLPGVEKHPPEYTELAAIAKRAEERYGRHLTAYMVAPGIEPPPSAQWRGAAILDPALDLHHSYHAFASRLYLIRPDGYVGFRADPPEASSLEKFLERIFAL